MKLSKSFLQKHTAGPDHAVALNKAQAKVLGMKYPLPFGWLQPVIGSELSDQKAIAFIEAQRMTITEYCKKYGTS